MDNTCCLNGGWWSESRSDILIKSVTFLVSPMLGFVFSLFRINTKSSYIILFLTLITFGAVFTLDAHIKREEADFFLDGMYHRADFEVISSLSLEEFGLYALVGGEDGSKDLGDKIIKFLISRVSENYHLFFMTIAAIFSFFYLNSLRYLTKDKCFKHGFFFLILVYLFTFCGIFDINGVRWATAAWIAIFSAFKIFVDYKKKYWGLLIFSMLMHSGMIVLILLLLIAYIIEKTNIISHKTLMLLLFGSYLLGGIIPPFFVAVASYLPEPLASWAIIYLQGDVAGDGQGRFFEVFKMLKRLYILTLVYLIFRNGKKLLSDFSTRPFFILMVVVVLFSNLCIGISQLGIRFWGLSFPFIIYIWLKLFSNRYHKKIICLMPVVFFYDIFYFMPRLYLEVLNLDFFYMSPVYLLYKYLIA